MAQLLQWSQTRQELSRLMAEISVLDAAGRELGEAGFEEFARLTEDTASQCGCVFFAGNGASAAMASHYSADLGKNARVRTMVFTDIALITALANDLCYEDAFAEPLNWCLRPSDLLVLISSSGNSPNVVRAAKRCRELGGRVVTFSAMKPDNALRTLGDLNFYVPAATYGHAETIHAAILHHWVDLVVMARQAGSAN
jgi:D-sedoheptulose 7-phosphate isomerase